MVLDPESDGVPIVTSHLTKKRRIRGGHKAYVTTSITKCKEILTKFIPEHSLRLKQEKVSLEEKLTTIKGLDDQILDLIEKEDEIQHEINESASFSKGIHEILIQIEEKFVRSDPCNHLTMPMKVAAVVVLELAVVPMGEQGFISSFLNLS